MMFDAMVEMLIPTVRRNSSRLKMNMIEKDCEVNAAFKPLRKFVRLCMNKPSPGKEWFWNLQASMYRPEVALRRKQAHKDFLLSQRTEEVPEDDYEGSAWTRASEMSED